MNRIIFYILVLSFLWSCKSKDVPSDIIQPPKMENVLWDYFRAEVFTSEFLAKDSLKNLTAENIKLQQQVFVKYNISRDDFYKSYRYYQNHPSVMQTLLDSIILRKRRMLQMPDTSRARTVPIN